MQSPILSRLTALRLHPIFGALILVGLLLSLTMLTYAAGGSKTVFPQLFYVPIILAVLFYHIRGGLIVSLIAGLLCGPWMPLDVAAGIDQSPDRWLLRLTIFTVVGTMTGVLVTALHRRVQELESFNEDVILAFIQTIDAKSPFTARHSERVAGYAMAIARELELGPRVIEQLRWSALLHDIGKLQVSDTILNKTEPLSSEEWAILKAHPLESVRILEPIRLFRPYLPAIRHHHERMDGRGYPDGIGGEAIPLAARILAVADAFEAMTADRPYRAARSQREALEELQRVAGSQFAPEIVAALVSALTRATPQQIPLRPTTRWSGVAMASPQHVELDSD